MASNVIALIPAAGHGRRIAPLPYSKELVPIGFRAGANNELRPKAVCEYLLEKLRAAGITRTYVILRAGKWDIPAYLRDGAAFDLDLAYLIARYPFGAPYTLDIAYPFARGAIVAVGFPDILFSPDDAFVRLLEHQAITGADVVLGLFPAGAPQKMDMVEVKNARVCAIAVKPHVSAWPHTWGIAVWTDAFTQFLHEHLRVTLPTAAQCPEIFVGDVIGAAIRAGLRVEGIPVSAQPFLDIGTPDDLALAIRLHTNK